MKCQNEITIKHIAQYVSSAAFENRVLCFVYGFGLNLSGVALIRN